MPSMYSTTELQDKNSLLKFLHIMILVLFCFTLFFLPPPSHKQTERKKSCHFKNEGALSLCKSSTLCSSGCNGRFRLRFVALPTPPPLHPPSWNHPQEAHQRVSDSSEPLRKKPLRSGRHYLSSSCLPLPSPSRLASPPGGFLSLAQQLSPLRPPASPAGVVSSPWEPSEISPEETISPFQKGKGRSSNSMCVWSFF